MIFFGRGKSLSAFSLLFCEPQKMTFLHNLALSVTVTGARVHCAMVFPRTDAKVISRQCKKIKVSVAATVASN